MPKILVVTSNPLMAFGGHLVIAHSLVQALVERGYDADLWLSPQNRFGRQAGAYAATMLADVTHADDGTRVDQVVSMRFPSYAARHPHHVCWLNHTMREYYDLWPEFSSTLSPRGLIKETARRAIMRVADRHLLARNVTRVCAQSKTVQARLSASLQVASEVVYPPPPPRSYRCQDYEPYIFTVSRLTKLKRLDLLLDALARQAAAGVRCVIAGEGEAHRALTEQIAALNLAGRVTLLGRIDEPTLLDHLARCRAVCFIPAREDYGLVTLEAFASGKPVITCTDSGGPAELVTTGANGFVVEPDPDALSRAIGVLMSDRALAEDLGSKARRAASGITWDQAIERLILTK